jgi:hypothetical protein
VRVRLAVLFRVLFATVLLGGCQNIVADYSLEAYKNATTLKAQTAGLVDKSGQKFTDHVREVEALTTQLNAALEFAAGIPNNELSAQQWRILVNPDGGLYGEFVSSWRTQRTTSPGYRTEKKRQLNRAFDYIICLEVNKQESKKCSSEQAQMVSRPYG